MEIDLQVNWIAVWEVIGPKYVAHMGEVAIRRLWLFHDYTLKYVLSEKKFSVGHAPFVTNLMALIIRILIKHVFRITASRFSKNFHTPNVLHATIRGKNCRLDLSVHFSKTIWSPVMTKSLFRPKLILNLHNYHATLAHHLTCIKPTRT
jgi:hypothetical protein